MGTKSILAISLIAVLLIGVISFDDAFAKKDKTIDELCEKSKGPIAILCAYIDALNLQYQIMCGQSILGPDVSLVGCDFSGVDFVSKGLLIVDLEGANLNDADFSNANFKTAEFNEAELSNTNFSGTVFDRVHFWNADLSTADLTDMSFNKII